MALSEKWREFSQEQRVLNVASEFSRVQSGLEAQDAASVQSSLERALELIDLTVEEAVREESLAFLKELLRLREGLAEFYIRKDRALDELRALYQALLDLLAGVHNLGVQI